MNPQVKANRNPQRNPSWSISPRAQRVWSLRPRRRSWAWLTSTQVCDATPEVEVVPIVDASIPGDTKPRRTNKVACQSLWPERPVGSVATTQGRGSSPGDTNLRDCDRTLTTRMTDSTDPDPLPTLRPRQTIYYQTLTTCYPGTTIYYYPSSGRTTVVGSPRWSDLQRAGPAEADPVACQGRDVRSASAWTGVRPLFSNARCMLVAAWVSPARLVSSSAFLSRRCGRAAAGRPPASSRAALAAGVRPSLTVRLSRSKPAQPRPRSWHSCSPERTPHTRETHRSGAVMLWIGLSGRGSG